MLNKNDIRIFLSCIFVIINSTSSSDPGLDPGPVRDPVRPPRLLWSSDKSHPLTEFGKIHVINRAKGWGWEGEPHGWGWDDHHDHHHHDKGHPTYHITYKKGEKAEKKGLLKGWLKLPKQSFGVHVKGGLGFSFGGDKKAEEDKGWHEKPTYGYGWGTYHHHDKGWDKGWKKGGWGWEKPKGWGWGWPQPKGWGWEKPKGWGWGWERSGVKNDEVKEEPKLEKLSNDSNEEDDDPNQDSNEDMENVREDENHDEEDSPNANHADMEEEEDSPNERSLLELHDEELPPPRERTLVLVNQEDDGFSSEDFAYYYSPDLGYYL